MKDVKLTKKQAALVKMIGDRMEELGLRRDFAFGCGMATHQFVDGGWVAVHVDGRKNSFVYPPEREWEVVLDDIGLKRTWKFKKD